MKKIYLFGLAVLGLMAASCQEQELAEPAEKPVNDNYTIVANMEQGVDTRTTVELGDGAEDPAKVLWSEGDKMTVMSVNTESEEFLYHEFALASGAGDTKGTFTGTLGEGEMPYLIVYPSAVDFNAMEDKFNLPKVYGDADTDYSPNTNAIMMANPMVAAPDGSCNFTHLGGVLSLDIKGIPANAKGVVLTTNKGITGNWSFLEDVMSGEIVAKEATEDNNSITILFKAKDEARDEVFYFPLPTGTYQFKVEYINSADEKVLVIDSQKDNTVKRAGLLIMPELSLKAAPKAKITFSDIDFLDTKIAIETDKDVVDFIYYMQPLGDNIANFAEEEAKQKIESHIKSAVSSTDYFSDGTFEAAGGSLLAWYKSYLYSGAKFNIGNSIFVALVPVLDKTDASKPVLDAENIVYEVVTLKGYTLNNEAAANVTIAYDPAAQTTTQVKATITPDSGTSYLYTSTLLTPEEYEAIKDSDEAMMKKVVGKGAGTPKTSKVEISVKCSPKQTLYLVVYAFDTTTKAGKIQVQKLESPEVTYNEDIKMSLEVKHQGFRYVDVKIEATGGELKQIRWGYMKKSEFEANTTLTANGTELEKMMEVAEEQLAIDKIIRQRGLIDNTCLVADNLYSIENMYYEEDTYLCVIGYDNNGVPTRMVYTLLDLNETDPLANFDASLVAPTVKDVYYIANSTGYKQALSNWTNMNTVTDVTALEAKYGMFWLDLDWGTAGEPKRMWLSSSNDLNDPAKKLLNGDAKHDALEVLKKRCGSAGGSGTAPDFYGRSTSSGALTLTGVVLKGTTEYATLRNKKTDPISPKTLYLVWETNEGKYGYMTVVPEDYAPNLFLKPNLKWKGNNARFAAYFFGNGEKWVDMTDANKDGVYEVSAPEEYPSVIFCRMNPGTTENNWDNKWEQTGDLTVTEGQCCALDYFGASSWMSVSEAFSLSQWPSEPIVEDGYVYLYAGPWTADGAKMAAYFHTSGEVWATMNPVENFEGWYSCQVPEDKTTVVFVRMNPSGPENNWDNRWNQTPDYALSSVNTCCVVDWDYYVTAKR